MNHLSLCIRPATPTDAPWAAPLIAETMGHFGQAYFGLGSHLRLIRALEIFFVAPENRMSHQVTSVAEVEHQPAGILVAFPGAQLKRLNLGLARYFPQAYRPWELLWLALLGFGLMFKSEAHRDEFYIAHLATAPAFRRRGVARALLSHAENLARSAGLRKLALLVDKKNVPARRLYEEQGFTARPPRINIVPYLRMVRVLS